MAIEVIDAVMGAGKSSYILNEIERSAVAGHLTKWLYVSPFLTEVGDPDAKTKAERIGRVGAVCPSADFKRPERKPNKKQHLGWLINAGENIACTHKSFELMTNTTAEALAEQGYTVVIDEALAVVQQYQECNAGDRQILLQNTEVDTVTGAVKWVGPGSAKFAKEIDLCRDGRLFLYRDTFLIWELPPKLLTEVGRVVVLTYQFNASMMHAWFRAHGIPFRFHVNAALGLKSENSVKQQARDLIEFVHDNHTAKIGKFRLSASGYRELNSTQIVEIRTAVESCIRRTLSTKSSGLLWTCYSGQRKQLAGKGYSRGFLSCNARATNAYADRSCGIYLINRYPHQSLAVFMQERNAPLDTEAFALAEMLQWIWRLRIRNGQPIKLVIPSQRMRNLLQSWLGVACTDNKGQTLDAGIDIKPIERAA